MPGKLPTPFLTWGLLTWGQQHSNHRYSQEPQKLNPLSICLAAWSALHVLLMQQDREVSIKGGLQDLLFGLQAALGSYPVLQQRQQQQDRPKGNLQDPLLGLSTALGAHPVLEQQQQQQQDRPKGNLQVPLVCLSTPPGAYPVLQQQQQQREQDSVRGITQAPNLGLTAVLVAVLVAHTMRLQQQQQQQEEGSRVHARQLMEVKMLSNSFLQNTALTPSLLVLPCSGARTYTTKKERTAARW